MKPVYFPQATNQLTELPPPDARAFFPEFTHREGATVTACYRMSFRERLSALLLGRVWLSMKLGQDDMPPLMLESKRSPFLRAEGGIWLSLKRLLGLTPQPVPLVAKASCRKCKGTGSVGRDTITGKELLCDCLIPRTEAEAKGRVIPVKKT